MFPSQQHDSWQTVPPHGSLLVCQPCTSIAITRIMCGDAVMGSIVMLSRHHIALFTKTTEEARIRNEV